MRTQRLELATSLALVAASLVSAPCPAADTVFVESFETDGQGSRYSASTPFHDGTSDYWQRIADLGGGSTLPQITGTSSAGFSDTASTYAGQHGSSFWAAEDVDDDGGNGNDEQTMSIEGIDIRGFSNLSVSALFAADGRSGPASYRFDYDDHVILGYQVDGGGFESCVAFESDSGGATNNRPLRQDADFDGIGEGAQLQPDFAPYGCSIPDGSTLDLRISVEMDASQEEVAFDRILVQGDPVLVAVTIEQATTQADPSRTAPIDFTVVFGEPVVGFETGDVTLGGSAGATTAVVTGSGATYHVAVGGMTRDGTVVATIDPGVAHGLAGSPNAASTSGDNLVHYDATPPLVVVEQAASQDDPTTAAPIAFTAIWSEPVSGFETGDVTLGGTAAPTLGTVSELPPHDGTTYRVLVGGMTSDGTVIASVAAGVAADTSGNGNLASTSSDNRVTVAADYGDAPDPAAAAAGHYPTRRENGGARHGGDGRIRLGAAWDAETGGQPSADGQGDDLAEADDEDGVAIPAPGLVRGRAQAVSVAGTAGALLNAWIDYDRNGSWLDAGEQIVTDFVLDGTLQTLALAIPTAAATGTTFARFRVSTTGGLLPSGFAGDGEVEDYALTLHDVSVTVAKSAGPPSRAEPGGSFVFTIRVTNTGTDPVDLASLVDDTHGDLTAIAGTTCALPQTIAVAGAYECSYSATVSGNAGATQTSTTTASGSSAGVDVEGAASVTVTLADVPPAISLAAVAAPTSVPEPGSSVTLTARIDNLGLEPLVLTALASGLRGDLDGQGDCSVPQPIPAGGSYTCAFPLLVSGIEGDVVSETVTAAVEDDDGTSASAGGSTTVRVDEPIDDDPPVVGGVRVAAGELGACQTVRSPVRELLVDLTDETTRIEGAGDPASYVLVGTGPDGNFSSTSCNAAPAGDDVAVDVLAVDLSVPDPHSVTASLRLPGRNGLAPGLYRLLVCHTIRDRLGNPLDGDSDGSAGGDFVLPSFRVDPFNRFANGHFDDCPAVLDPWTVAASPPNDAVPGLPAADDADGSPLSASALIRQSGRGETLLSQCAPVLGGSSYELRAQLRFEPLGADLARFAAACSFFARAGCTGTLLGSQAIATLLEDQGNSWIELVGQLAAPAGSRSSSCTFAAAPLPGGLGFDLVLDALFLGSAGSIFADGFESGDDAGWSETFAP